MITCNLAIEARVNHLIYELQESGKITNKVASSVQWLRTGDKWFLLPAIAKSSRKISSDKMPHQAISQICAYRNNLIHVKYEKLGKFVWPTCQDMLTLYNNFIKAMENMNVVLKGIRKERRTVLEKLLL